MSATTPTRRGVLPARPVAAVDRAVSRGDDDFQSRLLFPGSMTDGRRFYPGSRIVPPLFLGTEIEVYITIQPPIACT